MDGEWILERGSQRPPKLRLGRIRSPRWRPTLLVAASLASIALPTMSLDRNVAAPRPFSSASPAAVAPSPSPSIESLQMASPLAGRGPFVIFGEERGETTNVYAVDVGAPADGRTPVYLGRVNGLASGWDLGGSHVAALPFSDGSVALLRRGEMLGSRVFGVGDLRPTVAVSPDGERVAVASMTQEEWVTEVEIVIYPVDGSAPKTVATIRTAADTNGGGIHLFWTGPSELILIDNCHCDGGAGYANSYRIALSGEVEEMQFLAGDTPYDPGVQLGSGSFVFDDSPSVDCTESADACAGLLHSLTIADTSAESARRIVSRRDVPFVSPRISPNGEWIASTGRGNSEIMIHSTTNKRRVSHVLYSAAGLEPIIWVDDDRLIVMAWSPDLAENRSTSQLLLVERTDGGWPSEPSPLAGGVSMRYLGWLR